KAGGPAAGQPLAKAIPVIFPHHAGLLGADQGYHIAGGITAPGATAGFVASSTVSWWAAAGRRSARLSWER
ncbi:hypothetical protein INR15_27580, partial [Klebsiella pneumoniae]|nr:hypothetical protein [Klebsiella pneumoniae]